MSASQLALHLLSQKTHVPLRLLGQGEGDLGESQVAALASAADEAEACDLHIDDTPGLSIIEIESMLKASAESSESILCIVDYLRL